MGTSGVLLDIDGTLVDSHDGHAHAWPRTLTEAGVGPSPPPSGG